MTEVIELAKHVARRTAGDARHRPEPLEVWSVARGACERLSCPFRHQRLAFRQAADWNVGGEGRAWIAALELDEIIGDFEDTLAQRLAFTTFGGCPEQTGDVGLRRRVALDHLDALARLQRGEISRRSFHLGIGDWL